MIELAGAMNMAPAATMDLTVREIDTYARGAAKRERGEYARALWGSWHVAAFTNAKRPPPLRPLIAKILRGDGPQSLTEQMDVLVRIRAAKARADDAARERRKGG